MAATRFSSSASRSRNAVVAPDPFASAISSALAARMAALPARIAAAIAASAAFFFPVGASASTRAAAFALRPISRMVAAMSLSMLFNGAVMIARRPSLAVQKSMRF